MQPAGTSNLSPDTHAAPAVDIDELIAEALKDSTLEGEVREVGLARTEIQNLVQPRQREIARAGIDVAGRLDAARRRETAAKEEWDRLLYQPMWLNMLTGLAVVLGIAGIAFILFGPDSLGLRVAIGLGPAGLLAASVLLIRAVRARWQREAYREEDSAKRDIDEATKELLRLRVEGTVKPAIRSAINEKQGTQYRRSMGIVDADGLAEILDQRYLIPTAARQKLDRFLEEMPGGSLGLAGARGAGKTSLIRATCPSGDEQPEGLLGVVISAPVTFDARDFILHLFAELCRAILGRHTVDRLRTPDPLTNSVLRGEGAVRALLYVGPIILLVGLTMMLLAVFDLAADVVWAATVITIGVFVWSLTASLLRRAMWSRERLHDDEAGLLRRHSRFSTQKFSTDSLEVATRRLVDIWFQQSFTSGWSGSLSLPIGVEGGLEGGRELARQQMSMPEIVDELRRLVEIVTANDDVRVRIGIDELDKMESSQQACEFLNEIKVLFGIPRCFFVVSLSEDAMASFERRGVPLRDVFDSSFDDVIRVDYLSAAEAVELLRQRIVGMPIPVMLLCHCVSGGLPRDLIRAAREVVALRSSEGTEVPLSKLCAQVVASEMLAKVDATIVEARRLPLGSDTAAVQRFVQRFRTEPISSSGLRSILQSAPTVDSNTSVSTGAESPRGCARTLASELTAFAYYCATLIDFFTDDRPVGAYRRAAYLAPEDDELRVPVSDQLAQARQAFVIGPEAAWDRTTEVRRELGLDDALAFPFRHDVVSGNGQVRIPDIAAAMRGALTRATRGNNTGRA